MAGAADFRFEAAFPNAFKPHMVRFVDGLLAPRTHTLRLPDGTDVEAMHHVDHQLWQERRMEFFVTISRCVGDAVRRGYSEVSFSLLVYVIVVLEYGTFLTNLSGNVLLFMWRLRLLSEDLLGSLVHGDLVFMLLRLVGFFPAMVFMFFIYVCALLF